jgi:hypothetical protein
VSGYEPLPANLERVRKSLNELFKRNGRPWTYEEESTLAEICRSGEAENELASILVLRQKMSMEDRHFFPRSIIAVLRGWSKLLDTAAIYEAPKTPEQQKALQAALARWR